MIKKIAICFLFLSILAIQLVNAEEKFLSLKKNKVNVRYGPGKDYAIKYIYRKINLPIKQIDKKENWRRVVDLKNNSGWIHVSQLKKVNSIIILNDKKNSYLVFVSISFIWPIFNSRRKVSFFKKE